MASSYFGLSGGIAIGENEDLDDSKFWTIGNYYCPLNVIVDSLKNCPINEAFTMKVIYGTGVSYPSQIIRDFFYGRLYYRVKTDVPQPWTCLADESMLQWKSRSLFRTFPGINSELWMDIPEIKNAKECIFNIGVRDGRYTYRQCTLVSVGQVMGFQYISTVNQNQYFTGYLVKNTPTQISAELVSVGGFEAYRVEIIDVIYR